MQFLVFIGLFISSFFLACSSTSKAAAPTTVVTDSIIPYVGSLPLEKVRLPKGFAIDVYADNVKNARAMALSPDGTLFVGSRDLGTVYALRDTDGDNRADQQFIIATKLNMPSGVAFKDGDLYVAEVSRIIKFSQIEKQLANPPTAEVIYDELPKDKHHGWKYIAFGPEGKLYVPVGAPCNICDEKNPVYASITRMNADGSGFEIVQKGIRNSVGFTWHPETKAFWFTDNGRDWLGDDSPDCELNVATKDGLHFGFPYCHQGDVLDPEFGKGKNCTDYTAPAQNLGPHVAPLGLEFYLGKQFPEAYRNGLFIAQHGSWNRSQPIGYRVMLAGVQGNEVTTYEVFAEGWLDGDEAWGRPVDVETLPDGSMLVSDDFADVIYRIYYKG